MTTPTYRIILSSSRLGVSGPSAQGDSDAFQGDMSPSKTTRSTPRRQDIYMEGGLALWRSCASDPASAPLDSNPSPDDQIGGGGPAAAPPAAPDGSPKYFFIDGRTYLRLPTWPVTITRSRPLGGRGHQRLTAGTPCSTPTPSYGASK